jgi:hypothetical protein
MPPNVEYLIAQHVSDVFRQEPRNVGVIVRRGPRVEARFFGERAANILDGRTLRVFQYPDVYRQWVSYWRHECTTEEQPFDALLAADAAHFRCIRGGDVSDVSQTDSLTDVVNYLYAMLVSEGGLLEAMGGEEDSESPVLILRQAVAEELEGMSLLAGAEDELPLVRYPVRKNVQVRGTASEPHRPAFCQKNGALSVIETIDFTVREKDRAKDHAGLASYMFSDIRRGEHRTAEAIALVRYGPEDEESPAVRYALSLLRGESTLVNWSDQAARNLFLSSRRKIALG